MIDRAAYVVVEDGAEPASFTVDDAKLTWFSDESGTRWLQFRARAVNVAGTDTPTICVPAEKVLRLVQL